jgi:hypothetical protein
MGYVAHMGKMRNGYKILVGKPKGKRPLRKPRHRWDIKMDVREKDLGVWIGFILLRTGTSGGHL